MRRVTETDLILAVVRGVIQCFRDEKHNKAPVGFLPRVGPWPLARIGNPRYWFQVVAFGLAERSL